MKTTQMFLSVVALFALACVGGKDDGVVDDTSPTSDDTGEADEEIRESLRRVFGAAEEGGAQTRAQERVITRPRAPRRKRSRA